MAELTIHELIARQHDNVESKALSDSLAEQGPATIAARIVGDCGLQDRFALSLCLTCRHRVMLMEGLADATGGAASATLYCKELARDPGVRVTRCTSHAAD